MKTRRNSRGQDQWKHKPLVVLQLRGRYVVKNFGEVENEELSSCGGLLSRRPMSYHLQSHFQKEAPPSLELSGRMDSGDKRRME